MAAHVRLPPRGGARLMPTWHFLAGLACALVVWLSFFSGASRLGLIGPDEPRYASVARAMADSGDWVTPRLNGEPWFEKPVLYYWGAAASFLAFGDSEAAARLPSAMAATAATLAVALLAARTSGAPAAFAVLLILPTTIAALAFSRGASTDMPFTGTLTLAFVAAAFVLMQTPEAGTPRTRWAALLAWGASLGLSVLAKGPAGVLLAGGSIALWMLVTRRWREGLRLAHPAAIATALAVALPWYALCALRNPEFFQVFVIEHNLQRFLTPVFQHEQPVWYFALVLILGFVPWTPLLAPAIRDAVREIRGPRATVRTLALCWAIVPFVFFSASQSKLPGYILPIFPPLVLLMARSVATSPARRDGPSLPPTAIGLLLVMLAAAAGTALPDAAPEDTRGALAALGVSTTWPVALGGAAIGITLLGLRGQTWIAVGLTSIAMTLLFAAINLRIVPALDAQLTPRTAAARAAAVANGDPIYVHDLDRSWRFGLDYYLRAAPPTWDGAAMDGVIVTPATGVRTVAARGFAVDLIEQISDEAVLVRVQREIRTAGGR
ncbi:MAG: glycosyltransferase family 39 protein [Acidimicrobiia bacterium]|nr:glycosyltransferase family 39 protein [Acidimicrobiia bacterium]